MTKKMIYVFFWLKSHFYGDETNVQVKLSLSLTDFIYFLLE
jgi:hypothetical protein